MSLHLSNDRKSSEPLYRRVMKALIDEINQGRLKPDDKLPSEAQLVERFGVSRVTVRHALDQLVAKGLIYRHKGKGSFVCGPQSSGPAGSRGEFVGVVVPYVDAPHMSGLLAGLEEDLLGAGYRVVLCNFHNDPIEESRHLEDLIQQGVTGFVWYPSSFAISAKTAERLLKDGVPFVLIDRYFPDLECDYVVSDNFGGTYQVVKHLIERGCKRIVYLTENPVYPTPRRDRFRGYQAALEDHGLTFAEKLILVPESDDAHVTIQESLPRLGKIDGAFASNVRIVLALLKAMHALGWKAPDDLKVSCFDGYGPAVPVNIDLTSANQVTREIARTAVECLVRRVKGRAATPQKHVLEPVFHVGNTT